MTPASRSQLRKRLLSEGPADEAPRRQIGLVDCATIAYSSEDPAHPVENLVDDCNGTGGTYWCGARPNVSEHIVVEFDQPMSISRLPTRWKRSDSRERRRCTSDIATNVTGVTHLRLTIVPNKGGSGKATLTTLQLFA